LGVGYGGYAEMILYQKPIQMVNNRAPTTLGVFHTHNTYLEVLLMFGVVGFCLYIYFLIFIFRKIFNNVISESGVSKIYFSMYVSFLIWGIFEKMHKFSWLFIIIFLSQAITSEID
jgi:O-antigen ligase